MGQQQPGNDGSVKIYLQLQASAPVQLRCERCLQGVPCTVQARRRIRFVKDEQTAAQLDALDDEEDVLALPERLDLRELIEEELILALPLAPRHDDCRLPAAATEGPGAQDGRAQNPHPFAALAALKTALDRQETSLEEARATIKEREAFLDESETTLFAKVQAQQEREIELDQRAEDLAERERRLLARESASPSPAVPIALRAPIDAARTPVPSPLRVAAPTRVFDEFNE